jgi:hypothetical protein
MKKSLKVLVLMLTICSCSSPSSDGFLGSEGTLVSKIVSTSGGGSTSTSTLTYIGNKIKDYTNSNNKSTYTYNGDTITTITTTQGSEVIYTDTFTYDANNRVASETINYLLENSSERKVYTYTATGILVDVYSGDLNNATALSRKGKILLDANGEVTAIENYDLSSILISKTVFTNDGKNSPFRNITGFSKQPYFFGKSCNILTFNSYDGMNQLVSNSVFQYNYNSNNFPSSAIQNFFNNGTLSSVTTIQYFYQ